jgi:poly(3-hydroxyalkanoate) depolymerase
MRGIAINPNAASGMEIRNVDVNGQRLRVGIQHGWTDAPPLLICNGVGANIELVAPFVAAMAGVEIVIFDIPGVGGSPTPVLPYRFSSLAILANKLLFQLGYRGRVDVLGLSWGGAFAQQFAHSYPERCRRLILAATSAGVVMVPGRLSVLSKMISPRRYSDPEYFRAIGGSLYGGACRRNPELLKEHIRHIRPPRWPGYLYQLFAGCGWTSVLWLGALRQPTLIMHGDDDPIVPLVNAKILALLIRKAKLYVIDDGHLFLVSRARECAAVVRKFLSEETLERDAG